ncbi:helix-turn-helix domain-containing protein [Bacillus kwashiorkori]|uniref:helix-turn-helix domain-containing protein n=1 Tax=Bacillus kwashiorkori TaxID=1522318 RepID=UPI00078039A1|nr:helix-turn-helix domain-containing protein [Bacillus kwashiorkori]
MACINEKGHLTESAKKLLQSIETEAMTPQEISKHTGLPLFKIRSSLREMKDMGFVTLEAEKYQMNPKIKSLVEKS